MIIILYSISDRKVDMLVGGRGVCCCSFFLFSTSFPFFSFLSYLRSFLPLNVNKVVSNLTRMKLQFVHLQSHFFLLTHINNTMCVFIFSIYLFSVILFLFNLVFSYSGDIQKFLTVETNIERQDNSRKVSFSNYKTSP